MSGGSERRQPRFRRQGGAPPAIRGRVLTMAGILVLVATALFLLPRFGPGEAQETVVVEVRGDVPQPGFHPVQADAGLHGALAAAGVTSLGGVVQAELRPGTRVVFEGGRVRLEPMDEQLVFGLPLDVNAASAEALDALPGVGAGLAGRIVEERERVGPFDTVEDLERVKGIGPATVERLAPFVVAEESR